MDNWLQNRLLPTAFSVYYADLLASSTNPPPSTNYILTEGGAFITTESGNYLITE